MQFSLPAGKSMDTGSDSTGLLAGIVVLSLGVITLVCIVGFLIYR